MHLHAFRIVADGERPHTDLSGFQGQTPPTQVTVEFFGCEHSSADAMCVALLNEPHLRQIGASTLQQFPEAAAASTVDYLIVR